MKEIGIYIHIPFCKQKCYYCDFISYAKQEEKFSKYVENLKKEIKNKAKKYNKEKNKVNTIYIGGGTPSILESKHIKEIINILQENYTVINEPEITIEVNPGTVDEQKLNEYLKMGINRISIGLQTTNDVLLKQIGRIHTYNQFLDCYKAARKVGFKNINVDLMLALPNQTLQILEESLEKLIKLDPEHISLYSLIVEENTMIEKMIEEKKIELPDEKIERKMYWKTKHILEDNGYIHYEISNFAKKGYKSKHNYNCWNQKEYLGFGLAAHSYVDNTRYCNISNFDEYITNIEEDKTEKNTIICEVQNEEEKRKEYMLLGLRKIDGVNIQEFKNKFVENPIYLYRKELNKLIEENLLEIDLNNIKLTNKGLDLANLVWEEFV